MQYSIIVPCFNESKNIPIILKKFESIISSKDVEVILVNNGSTDNSKEVLGKLNTKYNFLKVVNVEKNRGYGFGIASGLNVAKGQFLAYTHADMQTDPEDIFKAFHIIEDSQNPHKLFIKGNRKGRPFFDQFFTIGMSLFETMLLKTCLWDINAQPNIFHREFFLNIKSKSPEDFSFDLYLLYKAKRMGLKV
jgi:polyisoprenyl-phosphate glycosyltransferase